MRRVRRAVLSIAALATAFVVVGPGAAREASAQPAKAPGAAILGSWSGLGETNTPPFHAPGPWVLSWHASAAGSQPIIDVNTPSGALVNEVGGASSGEHHEAKAGTFYLSIGIEGPWHVEASASPPRPPKALVHPPEAATAATALAPTG